MRVQALVALIGLSLGACVWGISTEAVRGANRESLNRLRMEMTREEVLALMGTETVRAREGWQITNPYRTETLVAKSGETFEVLYYYTDVKRRDDAITDDELTPIVLQGGKVVGWGWTFLDQETQKHEIRVR